MKNKGKFEVLKKNNKYVIVYIEKGEQLYLNELDNKYSFESYELASEYLKNNKEELDKFVFDYKDNIRKEAERRIAEENARKEAERIRREEKEKEKAEKQEKRRGFWYSLKGIITSIVATAILLTCGHFAGVTIAKKIDKNKDDKPSTSQSSDVSKEKKVKEKDIEKDIDRISTMDEGLSQNNFETLVAEFAQPFVSNGLNISTEDLTKFVSIVNIDKLVEENPKFAAELFSIQTKEEYLNDAAKVIGATYSHNYMTFDKEVKTDNFIRISDAVYGEQKEKVLIIEQYVDSIAKSRDSAEEVNRLVAELLVRMHCEDLTYLDDGVGFGIQVYVELIRNYLAKDVLTKENYDMLSTMTDSQEYVSNIFTEYDRCLGINSKKLTK